MKKRSIFILVFAILFLQFVSAEQIVDFSEGSTTIWINQSVNNIYNISVNNVGTSQDENITQVIIQIPIIVDLVINSLGTSASAESTGNSSDSSGRVLYWLNNSGYIINASETKYFWFTGNLTSNSNFTVDVITYNKIGMSSANSLYVKVLPQQTSTTDCTQNWNCSQWNTCTNGNQTRTCTDLNSCNNISGRPLLIQTCTLGCTPNWQCTEFSICSDGLQVRSCVDANSCDVETGKPSEGQFCEIQCNPNWNCTDWTPSANECPKDEIQMRTCTDLNSCNIETGKPNETQSCEYKALAPLIFIIIVVVIIFAIIFVVIMIAHLKIKEGKKVSSIKIQNKPL